MRNSNPLKDENLKIIFIIGAARSGTRLLADTVKENLNCDYLNEINDFWKKPFVFLKTDFIPSYLADKKKGKD